MIKQAVRPAHKSKTIEIKSNGQTSTPDRPAPNCNPVFVVTAVTVASDYNMCFVCDRLEDRLGGKSGADTMC